MLQMLETMFKYRIITLSDNYRLSLPAGKPTKPTTHTRCAIAAIRILHLGRPAQNVCQPSSYATAVIRFIRRSMQDHNAPVTTQITTSRLHSANDKSQLMLLNTLELFSSTSSFQTAIKEPANTKQNVAIEQSMKGQKGTRGTALLFL
jgi:hypothetical protein